MAKYQISGEVTISCVLEIEAASEAEARAQAGDAPMLTLCYSCANGDSGVWCTSGELDGVPSIREVRVLNRSTP